MTEKAQGFDGWIRDNFVAMNTALEEIYLQQENPEQIIGVGDEIKHQLEDEGKAHIVTLLAEGNTDEGFESGFNLLGNVGLYMAACRRHGLTNPATQSKSPQEEASALAMQLGASLGVIPRFASAHLETHNLAVDGKYKRFTALEDEEIFLSYNTRSVFAFIRASEALRHTLGLGVSHPVTHDLLLAARTALEDIVRYNEKLFDELDTDRFFYCVRPYYKTHQVGMHEYRGANAGDFAGINVVDLLLGLCRADDAYYSQLLVDKFLFMRPEEQLILRDCMRQQSLLDGFLEQCERQGDSPWFQKNAAIFLQVCAAHGNTATQHHERLIAKFIEEPAHGKGLQYQADLTASGPPLDVMLRSLKKLCDMRNAADRADIPSRFADLEKLRNALQ